jgi:mono/diheme cytochrome c family protein
MEKIQEALGDRVARDVFLISISVDPETDTPERLKEYSKKFHAKPGWLFLTGKKANVDWALYKVGQYVADKSDHTTNIIIGNEATGLWKKAFGMAKPTELIEIVEGVANDKAPATSAVQGQKVAPASSSSSSASPLNAQERRGRAIYLRGESVSGREIKALLGDLDVPSSTVTCAGCHGARGEGKTEGGAPSTSLVSAVRNSIASVVTCVIAAGNDGADYGNFSPHSPFKSLSIKPHPLQSIRPCL